jgi:predicted permease
MSALRAWFWRVGGLFGKERRDRELADEMESHLQMHIEDNLRVGMSPEEARRQALLKLGGIEQTKERYRERRGLPWLETLLQDVRFGLRMLRKNPGFTTVAIITLALGIGANTAIFSLTDQVLLRALPVRNPDQLAILRVPGHKPGHVSSDGDDAASFSYPMYKDLRDRAPAFSGLLARCGLSLNAATNGETDRVVGELVSGNYFEVLGVKPALGRALSRGDETAPGANPVAVLSYGYWTRHFGSDAGIVNKPLTLNGASLTVVGVAQAGFSGVQIGRSTDVFIPVTMKALLTPGWDGLAAPDDAWLDIIGRLKVGFTPRTAEAANAPTFHAIEESELPFLKMQPGSRQEQEYLARRIELTTGAHGRPIIQSTAATPLLALQAMVGLILLIVCANLAGLLVARGEARQREMAVRLALGAAHLRLVRQLLTESLLLALAGGTAGALFAIWALEALAGSLQKGFGVMGLETRLDGQVYAFTVGTSFLTVILFGLGPALRATRTNLQATLKSRGTSVSSGEFGVRLRKGLMISQVALSVILLVSAGYFARSLANLERQDLGVRIDHVVQFSIAPFLNRYTPRETISLFDQLRQAIAALPGVRGVGVATIPLFQEADWNSNVTVQGYAAQPDADAYAFRNAVGPGYFSAMGIPLLAGREFRDSDTATSPKVVVINQEMAHRYFAGRNPIGMHILWGHHSSLQPDIEIVGVVQNSKHDDLRDKTHPFAYEPYAQSASVEPATFYVRTNQAPLALAETLRRMVQAFDSNLPVFAERTLQEQADLSIYPDRLLTFFSLCFGSLATLLAATGLYGVLDYMVAQRTREIGVRTALGATRQDIASLILRDVLWISAIGLGIGLVAAFAFGILIQSRLYGVKASDPLIFFAAALLVAGVASLATLLPLRRGMRVDPMVALRYE